VSQCDAVLLACTCFPLVADVIHQVNACCTLLDPARHVAGLMPLPLRSGPNHLTVALTGDAIGPDEVRSKASELLPGWIVTDVVTL
jgi:hypothetical protein